MNTEVEYIYRDAGNFKLYDSVVLSGTITLEDIQDYLIDKEYFLPSDIGFPKLSFDNINDDDHDWHEIISLKPSSKTECILSTSEFLKRLKRSYSKQSSWK